MPSRFEESYEILKLPSTYPDAVKILHDILSLKVAYVIVLLALETKYPEFRQSSAMRYVRTIFCGRLALAIQKGSKEIMAPNESRSKALNAAAKETARCEIVALKTKDNFPADSVYFGDPIYRLIESEGPLSQGPDVGDREELYEDILVELFNDARNSI